MHTDVSTLIDPIVSLLAQLVSGIPGMIIPGLLALAVLLCLCAWLDGIHNSQ